MIKTRIFADADSVAREAAKLIAREAREATVARGKFVMVGPEFRTRRSQLARP